MKKVLSQVLNFLKTYKCHCILFLAITIAAYIIIYCFFAGNGFISTGFGLTKDHWLAFLGSYLSFIGTVAVCIVAAMQSSIYNRAENQRRDKERHNNIQPIFSITIVATNSQISDTAEVVDLFNPATYPKHENITLSIENAGAYPIKNVIVFDKYLWSLLKPNDKKTIQCAYWDSPDTQRWPQKLIVLTDDFDRSKGNIPEWFNINYEDVDGRAMFQTFKLEYSDETPYYSLQSISE